MGLKFKISVLLFIPLSFFLFSDPIPTTPKIKKKKAEAKIKGGMVSPSLKIKNGRKVRVNKFIIKGNTIIKTEVLEKIVKKYEGKELTISQLKEIADLITQEYWKRGYITSFAYIPAQKITGGVIEIGIIEGKVGEIKVEGNKYYTTRFIKKYFESVKREKVLNNRTLERGLLLLSDLPKEDVRATLTKGKVEGTTDIILDAAELGFPYNLSIFANNYGSRYTGKVRAGISLDIGNITKHGDILSLSGVANPKSFDDMKYYKVGYTLPLNGYGTKVYVDYSYMDYEVGKELAILGIEGESEIFTVGVSHPLIRARDKNLSWSAELSKKDMTNYLFEKTYTTSNDDYATLQLALKGDRLRKNSHRYATLKATFGLKDLFGGMDDSEYTSSSRPGLANGDWVKINLDLTNLRKIGSCQLITRLGGQWASDNLLTGEQMVLGGPDSVRSHPTGEFLGDYGYFASAELRTPFLPGNTFLNKYINWAFFVDHGTVYYNTPLPGEDKSHTITGIGAGFRVYVPCHYHLRFDVGYPVSGDDPSDGDEIHYWVQAVVNF